MIRRCTPVVIALVIIPSILLGQTRLTGADLRGLVVDQTRQILVNSTVTVTDAATNLTRTVITDTSGRYTVPALPPGTYAVTATAPGFQPRTQEVELLLGQAVDADFVLALANAQEAVTVAADTPDVGLIRTQVSSVITQRQIDALPTNGRNFIEFALLAPGVSTDRTPLQGAVSTSGLTFTGQRGRSNNIMVDGLDNNDPTVGSVRATLGQEAVREFQVLVDSYSAEFGNASGGVVNIVTKSGTNTLHGNSFYYFRDEALNARKYFDKYDTFGNPVTVDKPPFSQKQGGFTLGGPFRKNRTFYFGGLELLDVDDARFVTIDPTAADLLNGLGFPVAVGNVPLAISHTNMLLKVDHRWSPARTLTMRGSYADITREGLDDFGGIVARSRGTVQLRTDWAVSAAETDVVSAHWLNEVRGQYADENQHVNALDPSCGGPCTDIAQGGPSVEVTGVAAVGRQRISPQMRLTRRVQMLDTVSYFSGRHQLKFGVDYNHLTLPRHGNALPGNFGGRFFFSPIPALGVTSALDGLQKGVPAAYAQGYGDPYFPDEGYADLSMFVQDEWRRGRLILKPGLRYQRQFWQPHTYHVSNVAGTSLSYPLASDSNDLAPRVAMSYDVSGNARTIARGSYGVFYDHIIMAVENAGRVLTGTSAGVRTLTLPAPLASIAWNAPGRRLEEDDVLALLGGSYVSAVLVADPRLRTPFAHQLSFGIDQALGPALSLNVTGLYVRGFNQSGTIDYNPVLPAALGPGRRPNDVPCTAVPTAPCVNGAVPGTSTSVLQFTSFGQSWYKGLTASLSTRVARDSQFLVSYTLGWAEDSSSDFQSSFIVENNGYGRDADDPLGLPRDFDPNLERGPSVQDQRHRLVVSGIYHLPWRLQLSGIITAASGRPFTPLAGADLNGDGNGGQFPPDRARRTPTDPTTNVGRNSGSTAAQANVDVRLARRLSVGPRVSLDLLVEAFNIFNRTNFIEDTNQSSFVIFGTGTYPSDPLPAYGHYTLTQPPRQVQLAIKASF